MKENWGQRQLTMVMDRSKEIFEITKRRLGLRFDRELADLLGIKKSTLSQKISRGDFPFFQIRQLLNERQIDMSWLEEYEGKMQKTDFFQSMNQESDRLRDKDQIIQIQQDYIEYLKQQLEELKANTK
jgi:transcriptional regulator with XRE-family HTH domain